MPETGSTRSRGRHAAAAIAGTLPKQSFLRVQNKHRQTKHISEPGGNANHHLPIRFTGKIMLLSTNTGAQAWHETTEKGLLLTVFLAELSRSW